MRKRLARKVQKTEFGRRHSTIRRANKRLPPITAERLGKILERVYADAMGSLVLRARDAWREWLS